MIHSIRCFLILSALFVYGCGTTAITPQTVEPVRERGGHFAQVADDGPHVVFMPKGLWIAGLAQDASYAMGTWVRLLPGDGWPEAEPRPTLLLGRVAQRQKDAARLEILSLVPRFATTDPAFEPYPADAKPSHALHAVTKRIVFSGEFTSDAFVEGNEIYGAYELDDAPTDRRLASNLSALLAFPPETRANGAHNLQVVAGTLPQNPVYVLLDAPLAPRYRVEIHIAAQPLQREIQNQLQTLIQNLPGSESIQIMADHDPADVHKVLVQQGKTQTDALRIDLLPNDMIDQGNRVTDSPYTVVADETPQSRALAAAARAFQLLGYPASAAWLLEGAWRDARSLTQRAAVAPALADAYRLMERGDWALEIALSLRAHADALSGRDHTLMQAAAAVVAAQARVAQDFEDCIEDVHNHVGRLPDAWRRAFAHALLDIAFMPPPREYFVDVRQNIQNWNEWDDLRLCEHIPETCEAASPQTEFGKLVQSAVMQMQSADAAQLVSLAGQADEIGAPRLAMNLWRAVASALPPDGRDAARRAILQYARTSPHTRAWLRAAADAFSPDLPDAAEILAALRGYDFRPEAADVALRMAQHAAPQDAAALRALATEMSLSIGDAANAASLQRNQDNPTAPAKAH